MNRCAVLLLATALLTLSSSVVRGDEPFPMVETPLEACWGKGTIRDFGFGRGFGSLDVEKLPDGERLVFPADLPPIVFAKFSAGSTPPSIERLAWEYEFNPETGALAMPLPKDPAERHLVNGVYFVYAKSANPQSHFDLILPAHVASVRGDTAKVETTGSDVRVSHWTNPKDEVVWPYEATRCGRYAVTLYYSSAAPDGAVAEIELGGAKIDVTLPTTEGWYRYRPLPAGEIYVADEGKTELVVRAKKLSGDALMNLKAVKLEPAFESPERPKEASDGSITLRAADAKVSGVAMRYDPKPEKNVLDRWTRTQDMAEWVFPVDRLGTFDVEVTYSCDAGQGGSTMGIQVGPRNDSRVEFDVEETGGFSTFVSRIVGRVVLHGRNERYAVARASRIAKTSACAIRQVRLIPAEPAEDAPLLLGPSPWVSFAGRSLSQVDPFETSWGEGSIKDMMLEDSDGRLIHDPEGIRRTGVGFLEFDELPAERKLVFPADLPPVLFGGLTFHGPVPYRLDRSFEFDPGSGALILPLPTDAEELAQLRGAGFSYSRNVVQTATGTIVFPAHRATVRTTGGIDSASSASGGTVAKVESNGSDVRIGNWSNPQDEVVWSYDPTRKGRYKVRLVYSTAAPDGAIAEIRFGSEKIAVELPSTGSWYRYRQIEAGDIYLSKDDKTELVVRAKKLAGDALMNLKAVVLEPTFESVVRPRQAEDGSITLRAIDAQVNGVGLAYEQRPETNALCDWSEESDDARWKFRIDRPGTFDVEVVHCCNEGQGGSKMVLFFSDGGEGTTLEYVVEETGRHQVFVPRIVGQVVANTAGDVTLAISAAEIPEIVVGDIRQIRLIPAKASDAAPSDASPTP